MEKQLETVRKIETMTCKACGADMKQDYNETSSWLGEDENGVARVMRYYICQKCGRAGMRAENEV